MGIFPTRVAHSDIARASDLNQLRDVVVGLTSFPSTPTDGERCWMRDTIGGRPRNIEYFWSSADSLWLSTTLFTSAFAARPNVAIPYPEGATIFDVPLVGYATAGTFIETVQLWFEPVSVTPQTGSNYYSLSVLGFVTGSATPDPITQTGGVNTTQGLNATGVDPVTMTFNQVLDNTHHAVVLQLFPNGSPGTFYVAASLGYRLIGV